MKTAAAVRSLQPAHDKRSVCFRACLSFNGKNSQNHDTRHNEEHFCQLHESFV